VSLRSLDSASARSFDGFFQIWNMYGREIPTSVEYLLRRRACDRLDRARALETNLLQ